MGNGWKAIKEVFLKFWCNNIKKNYKSISGALAVFITTTLGIFFMNMSNMVSPNIAGIFYALDIFITFVVFKIMGKVMNGNGYGKVMDTDEEFRLLALKKAEEYVDKSETLNGVDHE